MEGLYFIKFLDIQKQNLLGFDGHVVNLKELQKYQQP